ncbi:MAG: hypothetical protein ACREOZ_01925, partial [Gloeomargaritales cyanobacterium]
IRRELGIGKGSVKNYVDRTCTAILYLQATTLIWPDERERRQIADRRAFYGLPHCVMMVDGTLLILFQKPDVSGEDCWTRKSNYAINCLVF